MHIDDVVSLTILVLQRALSGVDTKSGASSYAKHYFACEDLYVWKDYHKKSAEILYRKGVISSPEVIPMTMEEANKAPSYLCVHAKPHCRIKLTIV